MPYNMNFLRYPKAEHFDDVLNGAKESFNATGRPGNITIPVSGVNVMARYIGPIYATTEGFKGMVSNPQDRHEVKLTPEEGLV